MIMTLTPLKVGRLDEGIKGGGIKWGYQGGESEDFDWHLDVGGRAARGGRRQREEAETRLASRCWRPGGAGWPEATRRSGNVSEIGRHGKGMKLTGGAHMAVT
jgi:hypothetical protein